MRYSLRTRSWDEAENIAIQLSKVLREKTIEKLRRKLG